MTTEEERNTQKEEEMQYKENLARLMFLNNVINFAKLITNEHGKLVKCKVHFGYIHTIRERHNFEGFSFRLETGQSWMGGNEIKIWYHPGNRWEAKLVPVLDAWWQLAIDQCRPTICDPDQQWRRELLKVKKRAARRKQVKGRSQLEEEMHQERLARKAKGLYAL